MESKRLILSEFFQEFAIFKIPMKLSFITDALYSISIH